MQTDPLLTTVKIPAQDYRYVSVKEDVQYNLIKNWKEINAMPDTELTRSFGYDLDMYNANGTEVTVAVSVKE